MYPVVLAIIGLVVLIVLIGLLVASRYKVAGPNEASALGSVLAQLETTGHLDPAERNDVIGATAHTVEYRPAS